MQHERALTVATELAKKVHSLKSFESNMTGIVGMQSSAQVVVQDLQKAAGQLVFTIRSGASHQEKIDALKAVEGGLGNAMAVGVVSQKEIQQYDLLTNEIYSLINME